MDGVHCPGGVRYSANNDKTLVLHIVGPIHFHQTENSVSLKKILLAYSFLSVCTFWLVAYQHCGFCDARLPSPLHRSCTAHCTQAADLLYFKSGKNS